MKFLIYLNSRVFVMNLVGLYIKLNGCFFLSVILFSFFLSFTVTVIRKCDF